MPAEVPYTTIYTPLICQSLFHVATNDLHHRLITTPSPPPRELIALNRTIDAWEKSIPSYFQFEEPTVQLNEILLFARYRLSWRTLNLKILLSRPVVLHWAAKKRNADPSSDTNEEVECRNICIRSASATINSISEFISKGIVSRLSTWYLLCVPHPTHCSIKSSVRVNTNRQKREGTSSFKPASSLLSA